MENKQNTQFWQLWMVLSLFSAFLFPFTGIIAAIKMIGAKNADYTIAKRWTIMTYILFAAAYCILLVIMSIRFVHLLQ